jgi:arginyl-tRNA synthetase
MTGEVISLIAVLISLFALILQRIDKAKKEAKEDSLTLINYQLKELKDDIKALTVKFDKFESEEENKIDKAIELHIKLYHNNEVRK